MIEELLEKCGQATDIWFATNMEIYEYAEAFKQLVFSADGSKVYNPTTRDVWGTLDDNRKTRVGKVIKIPANETVTLSL